MAERFRTGFSMLDEVLNSGIIKGSICIIELDDNTEYIEGVAENIIQSIFNNAIVEIPFVRIMNFMKYDFDELFQNKDPRNIFIDMRKLNLTSDLNNNNRTNYNKSIRSIISEYHTKVSELENYCKETDSLAIVLRNKDNEDGRIAMGYNSKYIMRLSTFSSSSYLLSVLKPYKRNDNLYDGVYFQYDHINETLRQSWSI